MKVIDAKRAAQDWVAAKGQHLPGFVGALFYGSVNWLGDHEEYPPTSDLDVMIVLDTDTPPPKIGKFEHHGQLLEISFLPLDRISPAEKTLAEFQIAGSFRVPSVIADPTGALTEINQTVIRNFTKRQWVEARCESALHKMRTQLGNAPHFDRFPERILATLFPIGIAAHLPLIAALRNPTVRKRYAACRSVMEEYQRAAEYETILALGGYEVVQQDTAQRHLEACTQVFDAMPTISQDDFFFASDLGKDARAIAIDGTQELIDQQLHREAMFWIVATYSRCMLVLETLGTSEERERFSPAYEALLADIGINSAVDLDAMTNRTLEFLPKLDALARIIRDANSEVTD